MSQGQITPFTSCGFPGGSAGKESACNVGDLGLIPRLGRSPGEGNGYPLQYSGLENFMGCIVHGITKSRIGLSDFDCVRNLVFGGGVAVAASELFSVFLLVWSLHAMS